jgi:rSAM/selenodomain-associated transferase 2
MISLIMPTYNEAVCLENTLQQLSTLKNESDQEILLSDGGSTDRTTEIAHPYARIFHSEKGKALQLNTAAKQAQGDILFFVHADMFVPQGALTAIKKHIYTDGFDGGGFLNIYSRHNEKIKKLGRMLHLGIGRSHPERNIFFGDNGIFVRTRVFEALGGFKEIPIMEDYDFSFRMRENYNVALIKEPKLILDPRRHIKDGFIRTRLKWILIKKLYLLGIPPQKLANWYRDTR